MGKSGKSVQADTACTSATSGRIGNASTLSRPARRKARRRMDKDELIVQIIAWNLNWDSFDHETGEEELVQWVLDTAKRLNSFAPSSLPALLYANSLAEESEAGNG